jgi:hypothetical protein
MSEGKSRRGRPLGTGIDDRARLATVAKLIATDPDLKPTTAIKSLGVSDPSVIRRLRDKFNAMRVELMAEIEAAPHASVQRPQPVAHPETSGKPQPAGHRTAAIEARSSRKRARVAAPSDSTPAAPTAALGEVTAGPRAAFSSPFDAGRLIASWMSLGLRAASAAASAQIALLEQTKDLPHVRIALRQQLAFGEWAMALVAPSPLPSQTVH